MPDENTLHFFCGKMAAGKTTLAANLAEQYNAVLLCEDDWLSRLYPEEIQDIPGYIKYSTRLKTVMADHICALLARGLNVVLDFPANTRDQRQWFREIIHQAGVAHILHFVDLSNAVCKAQLRERSKHLPEGSAFTSEQEFDAITSYFQPPGDDEGFTIMHYQREID